MEPDGGNVLTRKLGPMPVWLWLAIITAAAGIYYLVSKKKQASDQAQPSATSGTSVSASQVPDYIVQVGGTDYGIGTGSTGRSRQRSQSGGTGSSGSGGSSGGGGTSGGGSSGGSGGTTPPPQPHPVPKPGPIGKGTVPVTTYTANGKLDLNKIAQANGITENLLVALNPALKAKYWGTGKAIPKGTKVVIAK